MGNVFEVFANFLEAVIVTQFYMRHLGCRERYNKWLVAALTAAMHFTAVNVINRISYLNIYGDSFLYFLWFAVTVCLFRGKVLEKLFLIGMRTVFITTIILVLYSFFHRWMVYDADGYMVFNTARVIMVLFVKCSELLFYELLIRIKRSEKLPIAGRLYVGLNAMVWTASIAARFLIELYYDAAYGDNMQRKVIIVTAAMLVADVVVYAMCVSLMNGSAELVKEKMKSAAYENRMKEVNAAIELHRQTMKIRHDMKNELLKVRIKLEERKINEAEEYLEEILNVRLAETHIVFTENVLVDAVINRCLEMCRDKGIFMETAIRGGTGSIGEMDLAILLSNLLDNAMEAAEKTEEKRIEIRMDNRKEYLCIAVTNSFPGEIVKSGSELTTTKQERELHGYGLSNVKDIVQKYSGSYQCDIRKEEFVTYINLCMS